MEHVKERTMQSLKDKLADITHHIPRAKPIVYLDYPIHLNFGDILILRGTERFFRDYGYQVISRASYENATQRLLSGITPEVTIVFHGGGNFGDLYPVHQNHREEVIRRFPHNKIVVLPQTVHFGSADAAAKSAAVFRQHRDLTLFVRDEPSLAATAGSFCDKVLLSPDMAHQLWPQPGRSKQDSSKQESNVLELPNARPTLYFMRKDMEAANAQILFSEEECDTYDWMDFIPPWQRKIYGAILRIHRAEAKLNRPLGAQQMWYAYCDRLSAGMTNEFDRFGEVVTSRLHGLIFSTLLGKRVRYLDNSYGKLGNYANVWFKDAPGVIAYKAA